MNETVDSRWKTGRGPEARIFMFYWAIHDFHASQGRRGKEQARQDPAS